MRQLLSVVATLSVGVLVACSASAKPQAPPTSHRQIAESCAANRAPGRADAGRGGLCKADSDCTAGKSGRCAPHSNGRMAPTNQCTYDACTTDTDCGKGLCSCEPVTGNYCVAGNCRVDGDCGKGGFCSPTYPMCSLHGPYQPLGYYCHTPKDECHNDSECPKPTKEGYGPTATHCGYAPELGHWTCTSQQCPVG